MSRSGSESSPQRRSTQPLSASTKEKLANFCHVPAENCLGVHDVSNIYRVPLLLQHQGAAHNLLARLALVPKPNAKLLSHWTSLAEVRRPARSVD